MSSVGRAVERDPSRVGLVVVRAICDTLIKVADAIRIDARCRVDVTFERSRQPPSCQFVPGVSTGP